MFECNTCECSRRTRFEEQQRALHSNCQRRWHRPSHSDLKAFVLRHLIIAVWHRSMILNSVNCLFVCSPWIRFKCYVTNGDSERHKHIISKCLYHAFTTICGLTRSFPFKFQMWALHAARARSLTEYRSFFICFLDFNCGRASSMLYFISLKCAQDVAQTSMRKSGNQSNRWRPTMMQPNRHRRPRLCTYNLIVANL